MAYKMVELMAVMKVVLKVDEMVAMMVVRMVYLMVEKRAVMKVELLGKMTAE